MTRNLPLTIGCIIALLFSIAAFFFSQQGLSRMLAESGLYSTWNMEYMIVIMVVAFLIAVGVAAVALLFWVKK